jgi:hypothetical protein
MTYKTVISRAKPDADYQSLFANRPRSGWVVHFNGKFVRIHATVDEALEAASRLPIAAQSRNDAVIQITIDTRG